MKRFMMLTIAVLVFFTSVATVLCTPADAYVYLSVTGKSVNIRAAANTRSKVLIQANPGDVFIAEDKPVTNSTDGSKWYKIVMTVRNSYSPLAADERFGVSEAYISANYALVTKLHEDKDKEVAEVLKKVDVEEVKAETKNQQPDNKLPEPVNMEDVEFPEIKA